MNFGKIITAMVTPFDQSGKINKQKTTNLIEHLLQTGSDGIVVNGTTGESPTLTTNEKLQLIEWVVEIVNKRVPVIAGTGTNNTDESVELTKNVTALGVDGIMAVTPYYNKPSQRGMIEHFKRIAAATSLPIMLYNIPGRSVVNLTADSIIELSRIDNIVAVKEASGHLEQIATIIENTDDSFSVYSGDDSLTLPILALGGSGVVSVSSHIIGEEMQQMISAYQNGNVKKAAAIHRKMLPIMQALFLAPNPTCVKYALHLQGMDVGNVRLPLIPLTIDEEEKLKQILRSK